MGKQEILKLYIFRIKCLAKKVVFLVSRGKNGISRLLGHLENCFSYPCKNPLFPPWKKSFRRQCRCRWI